MKIKITLFLFAVFVFAGTVRAQNDTNAFNEVKNLVNSLKYQQGEIDLRDGLAKLTVPKEFNFLDANDANTVLVKLWGNPPSTEKVLGLLMPAGVTPLDSNCWVVTISYIEDGHVKDEDANKINYDDLLQQMQKGVEANNKARQEKGYPPVKLLGWAAPPRYDSATHKLYWAKRLRFGDEDVETLNYDIRMLGRRGVLVLNAVASINQLPQIEEQTPQILGMVDFKEGSRYADFDPKVDKIATYGIAALVAGGIAAKLGFFKLLLVGILALKKFVIIAVVAIAAFFKKIFKGRSNSTPKN
jgi:uncharacterized membrane-anchored protein